MDVYPRVKARLEQVVQDDNSLLPSLEGLQSLSLHENRSSSASSSVITSGEEDLNDSLPSVAGISTPHVPNLTVPLKDPANQSYHPIRPDAPTFRKTSESVHLVSHYTPFKRVGASFLALLALFEGSIASFLAGDASSSLSVINRIEYPTGCFKESESMEVGSYGEIQLMQISEWGVSNGVNVFW